jgi:ferritin-like metal-binding protein YciE
MAKDILVAWLNNAHAMEDAQIKMLEQFIKDFKDQASIKEKLEAHLQETRQQREDVAQCIEGLGGKVSVTKSALGNVVGLLQGVSSGPFKDELVRNMIMIHAGEHFEHATYLAIVAAAEECGCDEVAQICARIATEEKAVADWSENILPSIASECVTHAK